MKYAAILGALLLGVFAFASCKAAVGAESDEDAVPDVTKWTAVENSPFGTAQINSVAYCKDRFIAVSESVKVASSANGVDWVEETPLAWTSGNLFGTAYGVVNGKDKFVLVGGERVTETLDAARIVYSSDGKAWTKANLPSIDDAVEAFTAVTYDGGQFIAVGYAGKIMRSSDGEVWTDYASLSTTVGNNVRCVVRGAGKLLIGGDMSGAKILSYGSNSWSAATTSNITVYNIAYGNDKFVAVGSGGNAAHSPDGINTWTPVTIFSGSTSTIRGIAFGAGLFVAVNYAGKIAYSNDNGETWTVAADSTFGGNQIHRIAYGAGKFVAVGKGGKIAVSN